LKKEIARRIEKKSFWDTVFSQFFENKEQWQEAEQKLTKIIIPLRHRVMHHRLLRLYEFTQLQEASTLVLKSLEAKRRKLKGQEKTELQNKAEALSESLRQNFQGYEQLSQRLEEVLRPARQFQEIIQRQQEGQKRLIEEALEPTRRTQEEIRKILQPFEDSQRLLEELLRPYKEMQQRMEELTHPFSRNK
jgi:hypothetical protein